MNKLISILLGLVGVLLVGAYATRPNMAVSAIAGVTATATLHPTPTNSPGIAMAITNGECLVSFERFAYYGPRPNGSEVTTPPLPPWQLEATHSPHGVAGYNDHLGGLRVQTSRLLDRHREIWLRSWIWAEKLGSKEIATIYTPETQSWEFVSAYIGDTNLYIEDLFVTSDGTVWGRTTWSWAEQRPTLDNVPVLSRFNERTRQFELAEGVLEIPLTMDSDSFPWTKVVLDDKGIFWIFAENDGLYRYDPIRQTTEKRTDLTDVRVIDAAVAPDGSIYFNRQTVTTGEPLAGLSQFFPATNEIVPVDMPEKGFSRFGNTLFDHHGRLWSGASGYRAKDGSWHFVAPYHTVPDEGRWRWLWPVIMLESSDGRLWYQLWMDSSLLAEGTAWYDPETGDGCMFTNLPANIIEDSQHQLWMAADGKLYKYPLKP